MVKLLMRWLLYPFMAHNKWGRKYSPATTRKTKIEIERIYSFFMGFPFITIVWADGKVIAWSTNDVDNSHGEPAINKENKEREAVKISKADKREAKKEAYRILAKENNESTTNVV